MQWYYAEEGQQKGPVSDEAIADLAASGTIAPDTLVWNENLPDWQPYGTVAGADADARVVEADAIEESADAVCTQCGRAFPPDEVIEYEEAVVCAECKPTFFQRLQEGAALPGVMEYGGFWIRGVAKFIDGLILGAVNMALSMVAGMAAMGVAQAGSAEAAFAVQMVLWVIQMAVGAAYTTFFLGRFQATPGKMACRLKVIRPDGSPITYKRALGRHFAEMLSGMLLYIGYLMAAFDDEKRTLHDRICDTRVIKVQ